MDCKILRSDIINMILKEIIKVETIKLIKRAMECVDNDEYINIRVSDVALATYASIYRDGVDLLALYERTIELDAVLDRIRNHLRVEVDWGPEGKLVWLPGLNVSSLRHSALHNGIYTGIVLPQDAQQAALEVATEHVETLIELLQHGLLTYFLPGVTMSSKRMANGYGNLMVHSPYTGLYFIPVGTYLDHVKSDLYEPYMKLVSR